MLPHHSAQLFSMAYSFARWCSRCTWAGWEFFAMLMQDLRFALRQFRKNPGFGLTAVLMLTLGIGASVAIFAFVDAALIKPLPYADSSRLVDVTESTANFPRNNISYPDYVDWKRMNKVFSSLDVYGVTGYLLRSGSGTVPVSGLRVSAGFFRTLGVTPLIGRDFYASEDKVGAPKMVMLPYSTWQRRFGGRRSVIGETVFLSGVSYTIIGVLPESFQFAGRADMEFWTALQPERGCELRRSCHNLYGVARLKDGVSVATALADMRSIAKQLERQYPDSNRGQSASVVPLYESFVGYVRPILLTLLGGAGLLLLIATVNVSSLLLVRSESRKREIAVRGALGASPTRLATQLFTEGLVLAAAGSLLGLAAANGAIQMLQRLIPQHMLASTSYLAEANLNVRVLAFAAAVSAMAACLFSLTPILRLSSSGMGAEMRNGLAEGSRGSSGAIWRRFGANLVVLELAIAVVLLVGAGLLGKSFYRLLHVELNFQSDHLAVVGAELPEVGYTKDEQMVQIHREILRQTAALPGVISIGTASVLPVTCNCDTDWIRFEGRPYSGAHNEVNEREASADYLATLKAKLIRGRFFTDADDASKPKVAIINQALAKKYFPGEDPIGKRFGDTDLTPKSMRTIVGVVDDVKESSLDAEIWPAEYLPFNQNADKYFTLVARTSQDPASVLPEIDAAIRKIDPEIGTMGEATMEQYINDSPTAYLHRSSAWLVGGFAALALLLGVVGLYGVIAYSVSQRTREIGVRMALGAQRASVYQLILKEAGWLTLFGIAAGLACSIGAATLIRSLLFGVTTWDVSTLAAVAAVLGVCAMLASYFPARRAASVNPVEALRAE
jgi:macrolide transport system ATP-binding/permease protein